MTVKEIVKKWLEDNGYEGLAGEDCGCENADLFVCGREEVACCVAGHKVNCPCARHTEGDGNEQGCEYADYNNHWCIIAGKKEAKP